MLDPTTGILTGYIYDAEGQRVEKVLVNGWNTPTPTTTVENEYLLGPNGEQVTVLGVNAAWQWTNVYAGARQLATYDSAGTHFTVTDWLGTKRMQLGVTAASTVTVGEQCTSLPYGDGLNCSGSDVNHLYFTGKERDTESGNDYFLARYYSSNMGGRFLTLDWSKNPQGVPYANYTNPQTLNLYAYVGDNPLSLADADGHCTDTTNAPCELAQAAKKNSDAATSQNQQQKPSLLQRVVGAAHSWAVANGHTAIAGMLTRYMGAGEAAKSLKEGNIPNVDEEGTPRPTHLTRDNPTNDAQAAQSKYELPKQPAYRATVPEERVPNVRVPEAGPTTSGGGSQLITDDPIPVYPGEIVPLDPFIEPMPLIIDPIP